MKTKIFFCFFHLFVICSFTIAQSDYELVKNFKRQYRQLEESIKNISSLEEYSAIGEKIASLKNDFAANKRLLDQALYPENYESAFLKIENEYEYQKVDLIFINTLTTQVETLQVRVQQLNKHNEELMTRISELKLNSQKDQATIIELKNLIAKLKGNINQRDLLVRDIVDSLLVEFSKLPQKINRKDAQAIVSKVNKENLFYNIERTISDNIQFTKVTQMTADDFSQMKKQYSDFNKIWEQIGTRLSSVYLNKKQKVSEIEQIDTMFTKWNDEINKGMWRGIYNQFLEKELYITQFNNSDQFVNNVCSYIDNEIKNIGVKSQKESESIYYAFADSVYFKKIERKWIPILIENAMITPNQKNIVVAKINTWKNEVTLTYSYWGLIIPAVAILLIIIYLIKKRKKRSIVTV